MLSIYNVQHIQTTKDERRKTFQISKKETREIFLEVEKIFSSAQKKGF